MTKNTPIRLRDLPPVKDLETRAILNPDFRAQSTGWFDPQVDEACKLLFGVSATEVWELETAGDDDEEAEGEDEEDDGNADPEDAPFLAAAFGTDAEMVAALEGLGFDCQDDYGRPLLCLRHIAFVAVCAAKGEFGAQLPGEFQVDAETWGKDLEREASTFRRRPRR